jgi:hypothetical protein
MFVPVCLLIETAIPLYNGLNETKAMVSNPARYVALSYFHELVLRYNP